MEEWDLDHHDPVWIFTMESGENRIGAGLLDVWETVLDTVEAAGQPRALVVTGGSKYWSTGLDLDEMNRRSQSESLSFMNRFDRILGRILTAPFTTVAALNGHATAGGALLALAHDFRIMRDDRGYMSLPSVDIGIPFTSGMSALITAKVPQPAAHDLVVSCRQIAAVEAVELGIVNRATSNENVLPEAVSLADSLAAKDPGTLRTVKRRLYPSAVSMLEGES